MKSVNLEYVYKIIRRRLLLIFRKKYIEESLKRRKGKCNKCGCCDSVHLFGKKYDCKYYDKETKHCRVFKTRKMPVICDIYPFDERDKWGKSVTECGFYWEDSYK